MIKLDGKAYGDIYKAKNGERIPDDEYVVFLAKDNVFARVMPIYLAMSIEAGCEQRQIEEIRLLIQRINDWRAANPDRLKNPDVAGERFIDVYNGETTPTEHTA